MAHFKRSYDTSVGHGPAVEKPDSEQFRKEGDVSSLLLPSGKFTKQNVPCLF